MSRPRQLLINDAYILNKAYVSDDLSRVQPENFPPEVLVQIVTSKLQGQRVVLVHWATGEFAVMPCIPGTDMPSPENVIRAYHGCREAARHGQKGT